MSKGKNLMSEQIIDELQLRFFLETLMTTEEQLEHKDSWKYEEASEYETIKSWAIYFGDVDIHKDYLIIGLDGGYALRIARPVHDKNLNQLLMEDDNEKYVGKWLCLGFPDPHRDAK